MLKRKKGERQKGAAEAADRKKKKVGDTQPSASGPTSWEGGTYKKKENTKHVLMPTTYFVRYAVLLLFFSFCFLLVMTIRKRKK